MRSNKARTRLWAALVVLFVQPAFAEEVDVKYHGSVDLTPFSCSDIARSSFIRRVCFDPKQSYMIIQLNGTYYHYCEIPESIVSALLSADSMGRFYNTNIRSTGSEGPYDCRTHRVPVYK